MMEQLNLSSIVNASNLNSNIPLKSALDVTCELFHAKTQLIPSISNDTAISQVVRKINGASLNDSCLWLNEVVASLSSGAGRVECEDDDATVAEICQRWESIDQFEKAKNNVFHFNSEAAQSANTTNWINNKEFGSAVTTTIFTIVSSS